MNKFKNSFEENIRQTTKRVEEENKIRTKLNHIHNELVEEGRIQPPQSRWRNTTFYGMAATIALIIVSAVINFTSPTSNEQMDQLVLEYHYQLDKNLLGKSLGANPILRDWKELYEAKQYKAVIPAIENCLKMPNCSPFLNVYIAIAHIELKEYDQAITVLSELEQEITIVPHKKDIIQFYLAIAYLGNYDIDNAKKVLEQLKDRTDTYPPERLLKIKHTQKALKLFNNIQKLK